MISIVPSHPFHVHELSETMRKSDRDEALAMGVDPDKALKFTINNGFFRKTGLYNGRVAAMWGVSGCLISPIGHPYLITGSVADEVPAISFARVYKREVQEMLSIYPILENYVYANHTQAVHLLKIIGFELIPTELNNQPFYKFRMVSNGI